MARDDAYFQFPLRYITAAESPQILDYHEKHNSRGTWPGKSPTVISNYDDTRKSRLEAARNHSCWLLLRDATKEKLSFECDAYMKKQLKKHNHTGVASKLNDKIRAVVGTANMLNLVWENHVTDRIAADTYDKWQQHEQHRQQGGWLVRLRTDLYWDIHSNAEHWPELKLKTLVSLYAIIGTDGIKPVTHLLIRALVSGATGPADAKTRGIKLVAESTIRYWLDELYQRGLFRVCLHNNIRHYALSGSYDSDAEFTAAVLRHNQPRKRRAVPTTKALTASGT